MTSPRATAAASALALQIPSAAPVTAELGRAGSTPPAAAGLIATFVGQSSADLALVLADSDLLGDATNGESLTISEGDLLRPAFEAACAALGAGVLGDIHTADSVDLLADSLADVFELSSDGRTIGWFGIRVRDALPTAPEQARSTEESERRLARISNVAMTLTVEIGRARMSVRDALGIEPGAVVELDRSAGAPADVLLNGRLIARGEVVVIDQDYAVRVTTIVDGADGFI